MVSELPDVHSKMYDVRRTVHMHTNLNSLMIVCCRLFSAIPPHIHTLYRRNEDRWSWRQVKTTAPGHFGDFYYKKDNWSDTSNFFTLHRKLLLVDGKLSQGLYLSSKLKSSYTCVFSSIGLTFLNKFRILKLFGKVVTFLLWFWTYHRTVFILFIYLIDVG